MAFVTIRCINIGPFLSQIMSPTRDSIDMQKRGKACSGLAPCMSQTTKDSDRQRETKMRRLANEFSEKMHSGLQVR